MDNRKILASSAIVHLTSLKSMIRLSGVREIFPYYHAVSSEPLPHVMNLYTNPSLAAFENDLDQLLGWFEPLALGEYLKLKNRDKKRRVMVISFDDGLAECYELIAPLLKRKGIPAVFFLNNNFIDNRGLFFRYKASILINRVQSGNGDLSRAAEFFSVPEKKVPERILMIGYKQRSILDELAVRLNVDFIDYLGKRPVYMTSGQIRDLVKWGFEIGGHSPDHEEINELMDEEKMINTVRESIEDIQNRFSISTRYFSFPFTSFGVPGQVVRTILDRRIAEVLMGTSGMKRTGRTGFIQRIPMEGFTESAMNVIKAEYFYYLLKAPLGKNKYQGC